MANKTLQTRISLKIDTWANWNTAAGKAHVLKRGEIAFVQIGNDIPPITGGTAATEAPEGLIKNPNAVLYKVGDGVTTFENLKWGSAIAADVYDWAKAASVAYNSTTQKIEFKDASGNAIGDGIDLSSLASDTDLNNLKSELTNLINSGGTANEALAARVKAIEDDYTTAAEAEDIAQGKANAVLGTSTDAAGANTVYGANKAAAAAQTKANANETAIGTINTTLAGLDAKFVDNDELASAKSELNTAIGKKVDQTAYDTKVKALDDEDDRLEGLIEGNTARIGVLETASATHATKDELSAGVKDAKDYTDEKIALVMDNSSDAVDSVMELADAMKDNADAIDALNGIAASKASKTEFEAHVAADNPHNITPAKIGAYTTSEADSKFATLTAFETNKTTVKEATHAVNADSATNATKATQDANGNVIDATYETKTVVNAIAARVQSIENDYLTEADFFYIDGGRAPTA